MFDMKGYKENCASFSVGLRRGRGGIYLGGFDVLGANIFGQQVIADSRHLVSLRNLYVPAPVEVSILALMIKIVKTGMVCVDIEAGCGYYSVIAASLAGPSGKVYSFEVIPECLKLLKENLKMNELYATECVDRVVAEGAGKVKQSYFGEKNSFFFLNEADNKKRTIEVESISLDEYFEGKESIIDFVKINNDTQLPKILKGMESLILFNPNIKILSGFDKEKIIASGENLEPFYTALEKRGFEIYLLPSLKEITLEELDSYTTPKTILIAKSL